MSETAGMVTYVPFRKTGRNAYRSPSGRKFTKRQVAMYYATGGFRKGVDRKKKRA